MSKHTCLYYESEQNLLEFIVPFFKEGFRVNELCVWIVPQSLGVEGAKAALGKVMVIKDLNIYIEKGQFELLSHKDFYLQPGEFNPDRILKSWAEKEKQALKRGFKGIRVSGDASWVQEEHWEELVDYEKNVNDTIDKLKMTALCTYPVEKYDVSKMLALGLSHGVTIRKKDGKMDVLMDRGTSSFYDGK